MTVLFYLCKEIVYVKFCKLSLYRIQPQIFASTPYSYLNKKLSMYVFFLHTTFHMPMNNSSLKHFIIQ